MRPPYAEAFTSLEPGGLGRRIAAQANRNGRCGVAQRLPRKSPPNSLVEIKRTILVMTFTAEIEPAILMLPVIRKLSTNVSMLPVMRQLTAFAERPMMRVCVGGGF